MPDRADKSDPTHIQIRSATIWPDGSVAVKDAAVLFGVTGQTILNWIKSGAPHVPGAAGRSNPTRVNVRAVDEWRIDQALEAAGVDDRQEYNEGRAKAMDWHYRAIKRRADASRELGTLVPIDLVADVWEDEHQRVRTQLLAIADRLATVLAAETDVTTVRTSIRDEIVRTMSGLSSTDEAITKAGGDPSLSFHDVLDLDGADPGDDDEEDVDGRDDL